MRSQLKILLLMSSLRRRRGSQLMTWRKTGL
uniref:Uncharacterized protein n=1 Tax=Arundo donax TaxID=35708 RepID=A0A0A9B182_ARUDO